MASGEKRFFSGAPCPHGHVAERFTSSSTCVVCVNKRTRHWQKTQKAKVAAIAKRRREKHPERVAEIVKRSKKKNRDHYSAVKKQWAAENRDKMNAYNTVYEAKKSGSLKPGPCVKCGSTLRVHAHHEDHTKRLEVVWLCQKCHNKLHNKERWGKT